MPCSKKNLHFLLDIKQDYAIKVYCKLSGFLASCQCKNLISKSTQGKPTGICYYSIVENAHTFEYMCLVHSQKHYVVRNICCVRSTVDRLLFSSFSLFTCICICYDQTHWLDLSQSFWFFFLAFLYKCIESEVPFISDQAEMLSTVIYRMWVYRILVETCINYIYGPACVCVCVCVCVSV